jgi:regulator of protease activity HflC (stomatin/prohibitin superfamily)
MTTLIIAILVIVVILGFVTYRSVKVIKQYQRLVLFRLGRVVGAKGPGLLFVNPIVDRVSLVDLREQYLEIPHQTAITADNASISIDFIMFFKVLDPVMSVVEVSNFSGAALNIASTTLRSVVGEMSFDDVLSRREEMNASLRIKMDAITERWGVKVTNVEVREVNPPPGVQEAMTRQMSAERSRRALVTESEGQKQAAVTIAEGEKQALILGAEGKRQATILNAQAEREAATLHAEGLSLALEAMLSAASKADANTLTLQYLDTLKRLGDSPSTKILLPVELTSLLQNITKSAGSSMGNPPALNGTSPVLQ